MNKRKYKVGILHIDLETKRSTIKLETKTLDDDFARNFANVGAICKWCTAGGMSFKLVDSNDTSSADMCMRLKSHAVLCLSTVSTKVMQADITDETMEVGNGEK